jgi:dTDP-4-dehydrorhamnose reductase
MPSAPILVTGGTGQLATALREAAGETPLRLVGRPDFDFDRPETIRQAFDAAAPALVVNAAAYTAVDAAETDQDAAWRANRDGVAELALLCAGANVPLIHVSTDYVFDGTKGAPYVETDPVAPQCVYGASKLAGEAAALQACPHTIVLRTSWVYAPNGRNFVRTMLNLARTRDRLTVVADQKGCPTAAADLAAAVLAIARRIGSDGWRPDFGGVFHAAGSGWTTWFGLANAIFGAAERHGLRPPNVEPIATEAWPTPARRPADSRLDCARLASVFGLCLPDWRQSVTRTVDAILAG